MFFAIAMKYKTYVSLRMGATPPTMPLEATDRVAEGVLIEVKAEAVAARESTARERFIV